MAADVLKDPRVPIFQAAMTQCGRGQPIQVFRGNSRYQYGAGFGDVLRSIWRFVPGGEARSSYGDEGRR